MKKLESFHRWHLSDKRSKYPQNVKKKSPGVLTFIDDRIFSTPFWSQNEKMFSSRDELQTNE